MVTDPFFPGQDTDVFHLGADFYGVVADLKVLGDGDGVTALQFVADGIADDFGFFARGGPFMRAFGADEQRTVLIGIRGGAFWAWGERGGHGVILSSRAQRSNPKSRLPRRAKALLAMTRGLFAPVFGGGAVEVVFGLACGAGVIKV